MFGVSKTDSTATAEIAKIAEKRIETGIEIRGAIIQGINRRGSLAETVRRFKGEEEGEEGGRRKSKSASCVAASERGKAEQQMQKAGRV